MTTWQTDELYDEVDLADDDLTGQDASRSRFVDCAWRRVVLDDALLTGATLRGTTVDDVRATVLDAVRGEWTDVTVGSGRLGAVSASGARWTDVTLRGLRIDYLNLRDATLDQVVLDGCTVDELDLVGARATGLVLRGTTVRALALDHARLAATDLTGLDTAALRELTGVGALSGATITSAQLVDLAPALAAHVGLRVEDD